MWLLAYFVSAVLSVNTPQITFCMGDSMRVGISLLCWGSIVCEHATIVWVIAHVWLLAYFISVVLSVNSPQLYG